MRGALRCLLAAAALCLAATRAQAFDESVHYTVVYAVAVLAGYSPDDAQLMARASQSLDDNGATTAFDGMGRVARDLGQILSGDRRPDDFSWGAPGQVFHTMGTDENRAIASRAHVERLGRYRQEGGADRGAARRNMELVYLGEYLHFVADMFVHPRNSLFGHVDRGHGQDRPDTQRDPLIEAIAAMKQVLDQYGGARGAPGDPRALRPVMPDAVGRDPGRIAATAYDEGRFRLLAQTVSDSWSRGNPGWWTRLSDTYDETTERARAGLAAEAVSRFLRDNGGLPFRFYDAQRDAMRLDADGNPTGNARVPLGPPARGSFVETLAMQPSFVRQRQVELLRGAVADRPAVTRLLGAGLGSAALAVGGWLRAVPRTLGGIALDPGLTIAGARGRPVALAVDGDRLMLETTAGRYRIDRIAPRSFATILRTVAGGEVPYITIGATPSDRPGHAAVLYASALRGTREGRALYEADVRFKALMTDLPLATQGGATPAALLGGTPFPFAGGDFVRLWITSSDFRLEADGERLVVARHGMRIRAERQLAGRVRDDDALAAYAAQLTGRWRELAALFPPFAAVEDIALATALVMWARRNGVRFAPELWMTPPRAEITPDYAPLLARLDPGLRIAGGVAVTPEDRRASSGRILVTRLSSLYDDGWTGAGDAGAAAALVLLALVIAAAALLVPPSLLWLLAWLWGEPVTRTLWRFLVVRWAAASAAVLALAALAHPIAIDGVLGPFDRDFLAFLIGVAAFPVVLLALLQAWLRGASATVRAVAVVLAIGGSALAGQLGLATALLTVAAVGPVPTAAGNAVLALQLAAADRFSEALLTVVQGEDAVDILPMPRSAFDAVRPGHASMPGGSGTPPAVLQRVGRTDPLMPFDSLSRIPVGAAAPAFYGPEGALPF